MIDIVTTLRRESFYRPTSRLNSDGKVQMGFELMSINLQAAEEIERLRKELEILHQHIKDIKEGFEGCCNACEPVGKMNKKLRGERDEARQRYCFAMAEHGEKTEARQTAKEEGWDCFKENA